MKIALFLSSVALILFSYFLPTGWFSTETVFTVFKAISCVVGLIMIIIVVIAVEASIDSPTIFLRGSVVIGIIILFIGVLAELSCLMGSRGNGPFFNFIPFLYVVYLVLITGLMTELLEEID